MFEAAEPHRPSLPLPPAIRGGEMSTWAYDTITVRQPVIVNRVMQENELSLGARGRLLHLIGEIPTGPIRQIRNPGAPDEGQWRRYVAPFLGWNWLEVPWFFGEMYFYRRIVEAVDHFRTGLDPFARQKELALREAMPMVRRLVERFELDLDGQEPAAILQQLFTFALWGNRADLSLWPAGSTDGPPAAGSPESKGEPEAESQMLVDQRQAAAQHLADEPAGRLDIILDNAGFELATDLLLADYWLRQGPLAVVYLRVKNHPTYVSDVTGPDLRATIARLAADEHGPTAALAGRLQAALEVGRVVCRTHPFWTSPLPGWEMPEDLRRELAPARLVVCKGDVNYRRLLGDRHWSHSAPFADIVSYFPAPLLALRTLKAQLVAGLTPGQPAAARRLDPHWMTSGRWGVIQFVR